ncbi:hypothetical protein [Azospirillum sp.]|uniref:coiled-coil domain-containing protein n=1 Tax=Azospirillum sp. TaxID=34012 RepID=UPI002D49C0F5|nr:hypothetical protein [Azospirillum sp.]HYF86450.1 hypothetical protein [Azospirillum sp.]
MKIRLSMLITILLALSLGGIRLVIGSPALEPVSLERAVTWAECLAPVEIPSTTSVTLHSLKDSAQESAGHFDIIRPPVGEALGFITTEPVTANLEDAKLAADIEAAALAASPKAVTVTLPADTIVRVSKGEFVLDGRTLEMHHSGSAYLLGPSGRLRFGPAPSGSYAVKLDAEVKAEAIKIETAPMRLTLSVGTKGTLPLGNGQAASVVVLQPIIASQWLLGTSATLQPERASGKKGLADLAIEAYRPGLRFDRGVGVSACARTIGQAEPQRVGVTEIRPTESGGASVLLSVPGSVLNASGNMFNSIELAVASSSGGYAAYGGFTAIAQWAAAIAAGVITICLFWWLFNIRHDDLGASKDDWARWLAGLFIGNDGEPSLSLFQIFVWTVITVWGFLYVFAVTGSLLSLTTEMMGLLGIAGAGSVLARWIAATRGSTQTTVPGVGPAPTEDLRFWQILSSGKRFDMLKLQLFVFTLLIGGYVVWRIADTAAFPQLDANTLLLLGISQSVYIGSKLTGSSALARSQALKDELDKAKGRLDTLLKDKAEGEAALKSLQDKEKALRAEKAALPPGATFDASKAQQLADLPALIASKQAEINRLNAEQKDLEARIPGLTTSLASAVKEMGLTS